MGTNTETTQKEAESGFESDISRLENMASVKTRFLLQRMYDEAPAAFINFVDKELLLEKDSIKPHLGFDVDHLETISLASVQKSYCVIVDAYTETMLDSYVQFGKNVSKHFDKKHDKEEIKVALELVPEADLVLYAKFAREEADYKKLTGNEVYVRCMTYETFIDDIAFYLKKDRRLKSEFAPIFADYPSFCLKNDLIGNGHPQTQMLMQNYAEHVLEKGYLNNNVCYYFTGYQTKDFDYIGYFGHGHDCIGKVRAIVRINDHIPGIKVSDSLSANDMDFAIIKGEITDEDKNSILNTRRVAEQNGKDMSRMTYVLTDGFIPTSFSEWMKYNYVPDKPMEAVYDLSERLYTNKMPELTKLADLIRNKNKPYLNRDSF